MSLLIRDIARIIHHCAWTAGFAAYRMELKMHEASPRAFEIIQSTPGSGTDTALSREVDVATALQYAKAAPCRPAAAQVSPAPGEPSYAE